MSVELSGPKGYEYQYLMTIYVALRAYDFVGAQLIVENRGGEDAELIISSDGGFNIIEVQVKSEGTSLDLGSLTKWMAHFPDFSAEKNLLSRLEADTMRYALFIARGRCTDETLPFSTKDLVSHNTYPLLRDKVGGFLEILANCYREKDSPLFISRHQFCQQQSKRFSKAKRSLQEISKRILVWEQMDQDSAKLQILTLLHMEHSIPQAKCESVLRMLDESVRKARDERGDVMPDIRKIISEHVSQRMFTGCHTERNEIDTCYMHLKEHHVLLLTGISFCGKTHAAEYIAENFRSEGYIGFKVSDIDEASRILTDMSTENRICILEDPFGGTELMKESAEVWSKLNALTTKSGEHRKLIVTSRSDLIQMVTRESDIKKWKIQNHHWYDLTLFDSELAKAIWEQYCKVRCVSDEIRLKIIQSLNESILQPGQLRHLAFIDPSELNNKSREALEQMAKADSNQLGQALMNKGNAELELLLIVLGMSTSSTKGLPEKELFQLVKEIGLDKLELFEQAIEYLETHGYIIFKNKLWQFTHPTYFEAALFVIEHLGRFKKKHIIKLINIAVSSIDSHILLNIVRKFERIYAKYNEGEFKQLIMDQAFLCLDHSSPAVRDAVLPFIISVMSELTHDKQKLLINYIQKGGIEGLDLDWQDGMPVIKERLGISLGDLARYSLSTHLSDEQCKNILKNLAYPEPNNIVLPEEAWKVCQHLILLPDQEINIRYLRQLMTYDEAMIRSKAAFFIMQNFGEVEELTELVFQDGHPLVIKGAIRGCFQAWPSLAKEKREALSLHMHLAFRKPDICAATNDFMVQFAKEHSKDSIDWKEIDEVGRVKIWESWARFFPVFLNSVPIMLLNVDQPYLFTSIQESAGYITDNKIKFSLAEAWYGWLERYLIKSVPQDFGLGIAEFLLSHVSDPVLRRPLGRQLLNIDDSSLVTVSLSEYIYYWDSLSDMEKHDVLELLQSKRNDLRWIWAVALTRRNIPAEILKLNPGVSKIFQQPVETWSDLLPAPFVADCLAVVVGCPFILGSIGLTSTDYDNWRKVLFQIFNEPYHLGFPLALNRVLQLVVNSQLNENEKDIVEAAWTSLCNHSDDAVRDSCFRSLLEKTVNVNYPHSKRLWVIFFEAIRKEDEEKYIQQVLEYIESISRNCDWIDEVFGKALGDKIFKHLEDDEFLLLLLNKIEKLPREAQVVVIEEAMTQHKPRLIQTIHIMRDMLKITLHQGGTPRLRELIKECMDRIFENKRGHFYFDPEIEDWIFKHKN